MGAHLNTNTNITSTNIAHRILEYLLELSYIGYPYRVLRALAHSIPCSASAQIVRRTVRVWKASQPAANMSKHHRKEACVCVCCGLPHPCALSVNASSRCGSWYLNSSFSPGQASGWLAG